MKRNVQLAILAGALAVASAGARCREDSKAQLAEGQVLGDSAYQAIDYTLTSDNYRKWLVAQERLDSVGLEDSVRIDVQRVSDDDIDDVVKSIEEQPAATAAIESAQMSVKEFVLTSIALAQSWDAFNQPGLRVTGLPRDNLEFLRAQSVRDPVLRVRPTTRFIRDGNNDGQRSRGKGKAKGKHKNKHGRG
jgi:hypothetical protein